MRNILLYGGPATGKTVTARAIPYYVGHEGLDIKDVYQKDYYSDIDDIENYIQSEFVEYIQIHPSMTYEDIVYGIEVKTNQSLTMAYAEKRIKELCDRAKGRTESFFVILDDITRTSPGRLLGNLLYALEYRDEPVVLADGKPLVVPKNVYFIITECKMMYGKPLEYAIRRRFDYEKELLPDKNVLLRYYSAVLQQPIIDIIANVFETIGNFVNPANDVSIQKKHYILGHGMYMVDRSGSVNEILVRLKQKIEYQVFPYLEDMKMSGIILATDDDISNLKELVFNQLNVGQSTGTTVATVEKVFCGTYQTVTTFSMADSYDYYVNSIIPNGCTEHRTIIECIVDAIFLNGVFSVEKALSDIFLNISSIGFEHRTNPGTYVSFLVDENEQNNYGYISRSFRPYHSSEPCTKVNTRWGPTPNPNWGPNVRPAVPKTNCDGKAVGYKVTHSDGTSQVFIALNAFRKNGSDISKYKIHSRENTASIYCALYHLVNSYLSAYESSLAIMCVTNPSYNDIYNLVKLEKQYWVLKNAESQGIAGPESKIINLASAVIKIRTLQKSAGDFVDVDAQKFEELITGATPLTIIKYEDLYNIGGISKQIQIEGVDTMIDVNDYQQIMEGTKIRQMVFQGPPGTSKTFESKKFVLKQLNPNSQVLTMDCPSQEDISNALKPFKLDATDYSNPNASGKLTTGGWDLVQFHPSYGYEDFIRGIDVKPVNGLPVYESVNRVLGKIAEFAKLAENAAAVSQGVTPPVNPPKFYLVIDEINRANLATVFGELIYGLEYRNSEVSTPYEVKDRVTNGISKDIVLGENLFIIGTMNTADKSIDAIDYAIRRRFIFVDSPAKRDVVKKCYQNVMNIQDENSIELLLFDAVANVFDGNRFFNEEYQKNDVKIGHTYFLRNSSVEYIEKIVRKFVFQVVPILREYIKDGILFANEPKTVLEHSINDISNVTRYEEKVKLLSEEVMLFIKYFGEKDSANNEINNQYIADYIENLCNQLHY